LTRQPIIFARVSCEKDGPLEIGFYPISSI
jgi:hypothetical protein